MRITLRPAVAADFVALAGKMPPYRCQCITALAGETVIGVGGFVFYPNGEVWASVLMAPAARQYPRAIHRAGLAAMRLARERKFAAVYAAAEDGLADGEAWLERLGFVPIDVNGRKVFEWRPHR